MNTEDTSTTGSDPDRPTGLRLSSGVDRRCRHCHDVALVYDVVAEGARCRTCGELDRPAAGKRPSNP